MHSPIVRQKRFRVSNPDADVSRLQAIKLIHRHADRVRVFEDLDGYPALMLTERSTRRLVLFADLSDEQITAELPFAWQREHDQADFFRDAHDKSANDEHHPRSLLQWCRRIWNVFTHGM
jgi:hypothetical protein